MSYDNQKVQDYQEREDRHLYLEREVLEDLYEDREEDRRRYEDQ